MRVAHNKKWTLEACKADAQKYAKSLHWRQANSSAWNAAYLFGWLEECTAHMKKRRAHTFESCMQSASKHKTAGDWKKADPSAYATANQKRWLEQCTEHMVSGHLFYTKERCIEDARKYTTRWEWQKVNCGAYGSAWKRGWLDECCAHMEKPTGTDNDAVYIWEAIGLKQDGLQLYKIGITSQRLGDERIKAVARNAGCAYRVIALVPCADAFNLEDELLQLGQPLRIAEKFDGYTEFRAMTSQELATALAIAQPLQQAA